MQEMPHGVSLFICGQGGIVGLLKELQEKCSEKIISVNLKEEEKNNFLRIEVQEPNLNNLTQISKEISEYLDKIDYFEKEYFLDIQSAGTEQNFLFEDAESRMHKNIKAILVRPIKDKLEFEGELIEVDTTYLVVKWNAKGQFRKQKLESSDIEILSDSAKVIKEK